MATSTGRWDPAGETTELLQTLIRNACVNDGTPESGHEVRNADTLASYLGTAGFDVETYEPTPGRVTLVTRMEGTDPDAPSLCLNGHTDVVPVNEADWSRDPFGGELVDGEVWGRGAVDMLNLTASFAVVLRHLASSGFRPKGDLVFLAVADEEHGSAHGARWMADHHADVITTDYVLTENGGLHGGAAGSPSVGVNVGEKGVAWRRLRLRGTPGHGSMPFKSDNALVKAAGVINALAEYRPAARVHDLWPVQVRSLGLDDEISRILLDPIALDELLDDLPASQGAPFLYSCTHTTLSPNVATGSMKANVIPDEVVVEVDVRTLPGETSEDVDAHLRAALGDRYDQVDVEVMMDDAASISPAHTPLWDALQRAVSGPFPEATIEPRLAVGFTDARIHRELGAVSYGAGLLAPTLSAADFGSRFHGNDERIDVESLGLTTRLFDDVVRDLLG
ncbi:MAG: M20/M25/M40 family metallo-hydrolase [Acidimicrobiales bacterium]|nr:M20/M25/M40 family metallo-hydrolase [Acidimicrobiales bacterium]